MPTKQELREAERFIRKHGVGSLPGRRFDNGETAELQRSEWLGGADRIAGSDGGGGSRARIVSYDRTDVQTWEEWMVEQGLDYTPLVGGAGGSLTLRQLETAARMKHVLTFIRPDRVELLYQRHVEGRTESAIAEDEGVTQQAISKRIKVAEQDFRLAFGEHWLDDIDIDLTVEEGE